MESIIQSNKECYVCKTTLNLHRHEVFFGKANRKKSIEDGLNLCIMQDNSIFALMDELFGEYILQKYIEKNAKLYRNMFKQFNL